MHMASLENSGYSSSILIASCLMDSHMHMIFDLANFRKDALIGYGASLMK